MQQNQLDHEHKFLNFHFNCIFQILLLINQVYTETCNKDLFESEEYLNNQQDFIKNVGTYLKSGYILKVPCGVTKIQKEIYLFDKKKDILEIDLPDTVAEIGEEAFANCEHLQKINIPDSVTMLGKQAFQSCWDLKEITIPGNITIIGQDTFYHCQNLQKVVLKDGIKIIKQGAFQSCSNLQIIELPNTLQSIERQAFYFCTSLQSISIPDSVTDIDSEAFYNCKSLQYVKLSQNLKMISNSTFHSCGKIKEIELPNSIEKIDTNAFDSCKSLLYIDIPGSVKYLGSEAFQYCENLQYVNIQEGLENLNFNTFYFCKNLQSINIPKSVQNIGVLNFFGCEKLSCVNVKNTTQMNTCCSEECKKYNAFNGSGINYCQDNWQSQTECQANVQTECENEETDYIIPNSDNKCMLQTFVQFYSKQNSIKIYQQQCPQEEQFYTNDQPPYQCISSCQSVNQYQQENDTHCVENCQEEQYIQNSVCVIDCTDEYIMQKNNNTCSNSCNYQSFVIDQEEQTIQNMCLTNDECEEQYLKIQLQNRFQCIYKCQDNNQYDSTQLKCVTIQNNGNNTQDENGEQNIQNNNNKLSTQSVIWIVFASILIVTTLILAVSFVCNRTQKNNQKKKNNTKHNQANKNVAKLTIASEDDQILSQTKQIDNKNHQNKNKKSKYYI